VAQGAPARSAPALNEQSAEPRSTKGARTRARLLDAAKRVFESDGFLNARISDISERASLSHGSFYHYFDSKEQIFREVAAAVDEQLGAPLGDVILAPSDLPPYERLREALRQHFDSYRAEATMMGLIEQVSRYDEHVQALMLTRHRRYADQVAESIRGLQRRKLADKSLDPEIAAAAIDALSARFAELVFVLHALDIDFDEAVDQMTKIVANILGVDRAPESRSTTRR
jgi:AcrR family transcriptional regulator